MIYKGETLSGWESDIRKGMSAITRGVSGGGDAITDRIVSNIHARYISLITSGMALPRYDTAAGNDAARVMMQRLSADTGYSAPLVRAFLVTLYGLQKSGKISEVKYDPVGYAKRQAARQAVDPGISSVFGKVAGAYGKIGIGMILLAALGAAVYFRVGRK